MHIDSIEVKNFRGFESLHVDIPKGPLTVFAGDNGSGKTSLIDALALGLGGFLSGIPDVPTNSIAKTDIRMKTILVGSVIDRQAQVPVEITCTGSIDSGNTITWKRTLNSLNGRTTIKDAKAIIAKAASLAAAVQKGRTDVVLPLVSYYGTGRLWAQKKEKSTDIKNSRFSGYQDCLDVKANDKLLVAWLRKMTLIQLQQEKKLPELKAVLQAITSCMASSLDVEPATVSSYFDMKTDELSIGYVTNTGEGHNHPLHELSEGYKNTISLVADIAYRMATLNPQLLDLVLTTPGVVLIDEIDQHLHPTWQQKILEDLMTVFPNIQFIVSTHSPFVISTAPEGSVVTITNNKTFIAEGMYGSDVNTTTLAVMNASPRKPKIQNLFNLFNRYLDEESYKEAREILDSLQKILSDNDPELIASTLALKMEEGEY